MLDCTEKFLGDQRLSYNSLLMFTMYLDEDHDDVHASLRDVELEGDGRTISAPFYAQGNPSPSRQTQQYRYRLNEHRSHQWTPQLTSQQFMRLLANLTAIRIRAQFSAQGIKSDHEQCCCSMKSSSYTCLAIVFNEFAQNANT